MKFFRKISFLIYVMVYVIQIKLISATDNETYQVLSFMTESALTRQLNQEINVLKLGPKIKNLTFDDFSNFSDKNFNETFLNLTQFYIRDVRYFSNATFSTCLDNTLELLGGKNFAFIIFSANLSIFKSNGTEIFKTNFIFNVSGTDLLISKNFGFENDEPKVSTKINLEFEIEKFTLNTLNVSDVSDAEIYQDFVDNGLRFYLDKIISPKINSIVQKEIDDYYSNNYINDYKFNLTTSQTEKYYVLDMNYVDYPETLRDNKTEKCGILFKRSGNLTNLNGLDQKEIHEAVEFKFNQFDFEKSTPQVFVSKNVIDDLITSSMSKYSYRGILTQDIADLIGLNFQLNIGTLSEILPNVLDMYSSTDELAVNWALYDPKITYESANLKNLNNSTGFLTGEVKLDCTFYVNYNYPYVKQIYSFGASLKFDLNLINQYSISFNLSPNKFKESHINIREKYGFSKIEILKNFLMQTIEAAVWTFDASLFVESLDLSKFYDNNPSAIIYSNGILIQ